MASTTRVSTEYVEAVEGLDAASATRTTKLYIEVPQGLPAQPSDTRLTKIYVEGVQGLGSVEPPVTPPPGSISTAAPDPTGSRLGCGDYRVFLQLTGGATVLTEILHTQLSFSRRLDEMSDARVELAAGQDADCIAQLAAITPFDHEIAIWRDGVESWVGPVTEPIFTYDGLTITARDLFQWFERRILPTDRTFTATDLAVIAQTYADDALAQDPSPNITVSITPTGVLGTRSVAATLFRRASDEIRELARTGLDFTAIARTILFGGEEVGTPPITILTADIFEIDAARLAGLSQANDVFVLGSSGGGVSSPTVGHSGGLDTPLIQQVYSEPAILDADSALHAAQTRFQLLHDAPIFITGRLLESAPIPFSELVPGARVEVRQQVGFKRIDEECRLLSVDVTATATDDGVTEDVRLALEPIGTVGD